MNETRTTRPGDQEPGATSAQGTAGPLSLDLHVAKLTDVGRARPHNEDYLDYYIPPDARQLTRKGSIYLVADGMGGHQAGEVASQGAVELTIGQYYGDTGHDVATSLVRAFRSANQQIYDQAQADPSKGGMGTTLVAAVIVGHKVFVANVGDSRAYLINAKGITQITEDHSWVEEQVRAGLLTADQARRHPQRNLVTRALGSKADVQVDLFEGEIGVGDTLLMCSDGLSGRVEDQELATIARQYPPHEAVRQLVALANERGGNDNISVLIVSAEREATTVPATVLAPPREKQARRSALGPALAGVLVVLLLAAGAVLGLPYIRSWLGATPTAVATAVASPSLPADTATPETLPSATAGPIVTATAMLSVTAAMTATQPTATLAPTSTSTSTSTPTSTSTGTRAAPTATGTPTATRQPEVQAPTLDGPEEDAGLQGEVTFKWTYAGSLPSGTAFQVLVWRDGQSEHWGAAAHTAEQEQRIDVDEVPQVRDGGAGKYYWTVAVVRTEDDHALREGAPRSFNYVGIQQPAKKPTPKAPAKPTSSGGTGT